MKRILFVAAMVLCAAAASAKVWIGGSLGLSVLAPNGGDNVTALTIAPEVGYNFNEKWALGMALEESAVFAGDNVNAFYFSPYGRYSFARVGIANFFVDGGLLVGFQNYSTGYVKTDSHTAFGLGFRPGVKIELNEHLALEAKTGYLGVRAVTDVATEFGIGVNNEELSFGLVYEF